MDLAMLPGLLCIHYENNVDTVKIVGEIYTFIAIVYTYQNKYFQIFSVLLMRIEIIFEF